MRRFWDRRAREDPFYFVDNRLDYGRPDLDRFWTSGAADLDRLLEGLGARVEPTDVVVEIGCGVGRLTRGLAERAATVVALDVSERMLDLARSHNGGLPNVRWVHGDGVSLAGVPDGSADVCLSHVVFQHIPDPNLTLGYVREMGRVLRPGGWAGFQISNDPDIHRPPPAPARLAARIGSLAARAPRGQSDPAWLGSAVGLEDLHEAAAASGLDVERVVGAGTQFCLVRLRRIAVPGSPE